MCVCVADVNKQPFHEPSTHVDWKSKSGAVTGLGTRPRPVVDTVHFGCSQIRFNPVGAPFTTTEPKCAWWQRNTSTTRTQGKSEMQEAEASKPFGLSLTDLKRPDYAQSERDFS